MERIVLCFPRNGATARNVSIFAPLSLLTLAAGLREEFVVEIFDERVQPIEAFYTALEKRPILVGISSLTGVQIKHGLALSKIAHDYDTPTVWGGVHASLLPDQTLNHPLVDFVIQGEGELALLHLARALHQKQSIADHRIVAPSPSLDTMPQLPYELVNMEDYLTVARKPGNRYAMFTFSRGCPYQCGYCSSGYLTKKWRHYPIQIAHERLSSFIRDYRLDYIHFPDENLTANLAVFHEFFQQFDHNVEFCFQSRLNTVPRLPLDRLAELGCETIASGLESGSNRILRLINKRETVEEYLEANRHLASSGIQAKYSMMMGFPTETMQDIYDTLDVTLRVLEENPTATFNPFYVYQPYPGTPMARQYNVQGCENLESWAEFGRHNFETPFVAKNKSLLQKITFSSKYVGRLFPSMFPDDREVADLTEQLTNEWRTKTFDSQCWDQLYDKHLQIIHHYFGEHAY